MPMLFAAAAAAAIAATAPSQDARPTAGASAQATVTIRIVSGVELHWADKQIGDVPAARTAEVRTADGLVKVRLIEFE